MTCRRYSRPTTRWCSSSTSTHLCSSWKRARPGPEVQRALELLKDHDLVRTVLNKSRSPAGRYDYL